MWWIGAAVAYHEAFGTKTLYNNYGDSAPILSALIAGIGLASVYPVAQVTGIRGIFMRAIYICGALAVAGVGTPALAQYPIINDVIAQTIMGMNSGMPDSCYGRVNCQGAGAG